MKAILKEIREIKSTSKELREFGWVMGIACALITGISAWKGHNFLAWAVAAAIFVVTGFFYPQGLKPLQKIWMTLAVLMGWVMSRIILSIVFYLILTPISLLTRIKGNSHLDLRFRTDQSSYWISKSSADTPADKYEKQY